MNKFFVILSYFVFPIVLITVAFPQSKDLDNYYSILKEINSQPLSAQIRELQNFVKRHPRFERGYVKLLQKYYLNQEIHEAEKFFYGLAEQEQYKLNSHWMLSRIAQEQDDLKTTSKFLASALERKKLSLELLKDYLKHIGKSDIEKTVDLDTTFIDESTKIILTALLSSENLDFKEAISSLGLLSNKKSHQLSLWYEWGKWYFRLGEYTKADSIWNLGKEIAKNRNDLEFETKFLLGLAALPKIPENARLQYYQSVYKIADNIGDLYSKIFAAGNMAITYRLRGNYKDSEELFKQAIESCTILKNNKALSEWYSEYGRLLVYMKRYYDALACYDKSEDFAHQANNLRLLIKTKRNKGDLYRSISQIELARNNYQEAYAAAKQAGLTRLELSSLMGLADILFFEKNFKEARNSYKHYLSLVGDRSGFENNIAYCHIRIGRSYLCESEPSEAKKHFLKSLKSTSKSGYDYNKLWSRIYLAEVELIENNIQQAIQLYKDCLKQAETKKDTSSLSSVYLGLGNAYLKSKKLSQAIFNYKKAASLIENIRQKLRTERFRIEYFVESSDVYERLIDCYLQLIGDQNTKYLNSVYVCLEKSRGRSLQDLKIIRNTKRNNVDNSKQANLAYKKARVHLEKIQRYLRSNYDNLVLNEANFQKHLAEIQTARRELIDQQLRLKDELSKNIATTNGDHSTIAEIRDFLNRNNLGLLYYRISENNSFIFTVIQNQIRIVKLDITESNANTLIDSLISPFYQFSESSISRTPFRADIAHVLYRKLIKPVEDLIELSQDLLIVPDISIMNLPFEMLLSEAPIKNEFYPTDKPNYATDFLQHKYNIIYCPTPSLLFQTRKTAGSKSKILILANPVPTELKLTDKQMIVNNIPKTNKLRNAIGWRLDPLPFSEIEADRIKQLVGPVQILKRSNATKINLIKEAKEYSILHFATHGFIDSTDDTFSGLVLAMDSDSTQDGILMGYEISDLELNSELVTLSACETGRGRIVKGEGILGLPRLFISAGAKSVLMTLWKVDDMFSSRLMPEFYKYLIIDKETKIMALAKAKRALLEKRESRNGIYYQHPLFWASFTLYGNPSKIDQEHISETLLSLFAAILTIALFITVVKTYQKKYK